jgi:hypothetical protein
MTWFGCGKREKRKKRSYQLADTNGYIPFLE